MSPWYLALRTARRKAGLCLCRGPARQPGSSGQARPAARRPLCARLCPPASPPGRRHQLTAAAPGRARRSLGDAAPRMGDEPGSAGRRCRGEQAAAPGEQQRRAEPVPLAGGGPRKEAGGGEEGRKKGRVAAATAGTPVAALPRRRSGEAVYGLGGGGRLYAKPVSDRRGRDGRARAAGSQLLSRPAAGKVCWGAGVAPDRGAQWPLLPAPHPAGAAWGRAEQPLAVRAPAPCSGGTRGAPRCADTVIAARDGQSRENGRSGSSWLVPLGGEDRARQTVGKSS